MREEERLQQEERAELEGAPGCASSEVERMVGAVAEAARRYGVLLACAPVAEGVVASVGVGYLAHVGEGSLELCRADAVQPRLGQVALGPLGRRRGRGRASDSPSGCSRASGARRAVSAAASAPLLACVVRRPLRTPRRSTAT